MVNKSGPVYLDFANNRELPRHCTKLQHREKGTPKKTYPINYNANPKPKIKTTLEMKKQSCFGW